MTSGRRGDRSKTVATWIAVVGGTLGLHRFYLHGWRDRWGWLLWLPTLAGAYGALRMGELGQDDRLGSLLVPLLGLSIVVTMLTAIFYGLMPDEKWDARFNPGGSAPSLPLANVVGAIAGLAIGATTLMASIAFVAQRYFEYDAEPHAAALAAPVIVASVATGELRARHAPQRQAKSQRLAP